MARDCTVLGSDAAAAFAQGHRSVGRIQRRLPRAESSWGHSVVALLAVGPHGYPRYGSLQLSPIFAPCIRG